MAENGYGETAVGKIRKCTKACFEYGIDEDLISKNPARKLEMPTIRKKICERFLSLEEISTLLSVAAVGRRNAVGAISAAHPPVL
jgi:site-specific recombinase XerD